MKTDKDVAIGLMKQEYLTKGLRSSETQRR